MTIIWWWNYASVCLTLLLPQPPYLSPSWTGTLGRFLHSQPIGSMSLACLVPLQVSLSFGNSSLSICFSSVQSVQPDGNCFEIYLFKSQLHISLLMFRVRFSSCPCHSCLTTASSLQTVLSPGLWLPEHSNLQRHFSHKVAVTGALIHTAANNSVCHPQWLCQSWKTTGKKTWKCSDKEALEAVGSYSFFNTQARLKNRQWTLPTEKRVVSAWTLELQTPEIFR